MLLKPSFVTNTYQHVVRFAGLGLLALTPLPAAAQGWYAGAGLGQAQADLKSFRQEIEDYGSTTYGRDCASAGIRCQSDEDDKDTAFKIFGGYRFNQHFAVEGMFVDFGKFRRQESLTDGVDTLAVDSKSEADGIGIAAVGFLPVTDRLSVLAKVGVLRWKAQTQTTFTDTAFGTAQPAEEPTPPPEDPNVAPASFRAQSFTDPDFDGSSQDRASASGTDLMFGLGAEYALNKQWSVRGEWERFKDIGDDNKTGESDIDLLSIGVLFKF